MADAVKHPPGGSVVSDLEGILRTRRTKFFVYGFIFAFVICTTFIAFSPSGSASPWFNSFFATASASAAPYRSQFSSFFLHIFPNSSSPSITTSTTISSGVGDSNGRVGDGPVFTPALQNSKESGETQVLSAKDQAEKGGSLQQNGGPSSIRTEEPNGNHVLSPAKKGGSSLQSTGVPSSNQSEKRVGSLKNRDSRKKNQTSAGVSEMVKSEVRERNQTKAVSGEIKGDSLIKNQTKGVVGSARGPVPGAAPKNVSASKGIERKGVVDGGKSSNFSASLAKGNRSSALVAASNGDQINKKWSIESMLGCDIFHGTWVRDDSYPLYKEGSCPHIDEPFDCFLNGRSERAYQKLRWQPSGCNIPRLNATDMLERLRGKRLVFVGDSLNRNMWESLVCILRNSVKDTRKVFEASGRHEFRTEGSYSFLFKDYNCTVEFFRSPFLVQEWEMPDSKGKKKETLRLDIIERSSSKYKDAHVIIFNTGHWWTHEKTSKGKDYYQEGNRVYGELNVVEAFHKALNTWAKWVDANVNPHKTLVFFRGYSASHFSGGQWNSGGQCHKETEPIKNEKYLSSYPPKMNVLESVIKGMKTPVSYLNITRMTDYRKDAHPSIYRKQNLTEEERRSPERFQDCSHWCLPGVPDSWNELVYAQMLIKQHQKQ